MTDQSTIGARSAVAESWRLDANQIIAPRGYLAAAVAAGIKKDGGRLDVGILYSEVPSIAAARFTTNVVKAAPVLVSQENLEASGGEIRAIIANSGNANACTGKAGLAVASNMARLAGEVLRVPPEQTLVCSTGVIGVPLPFERIEKQVRKLRESLSPGQIGAVAKAIMTTDTVPKVCIAEADCHGSLIRISGMTKGAGMIHPRMATTLGFVLTDAWITRSLLEEALTEACERSYNRMTVDGDTSTNDTLAVMANGASGAPIIDQKDETYDFFAQGLTRVCQSLAQQIVRDGEGATKFVEIVVYGAADEASAAQVARSIANSPLVKTALAGEDANWGRIICAAGYSGIQFDYTKVSIAIGDLPVCQNGSGLPFDEARAKEILSQKDIRITLDLNAGSYSSTMWTCDLTKEYIHINADYRT